MNNLLFTCLIIALLYYFCYYLPSQKKLNPDPTKLTHSVFTQTDPTQTYESEEIKELKKDIQQKEQTIIGLNDSYNKLETKKNNEIDNLKNEISELVKRPLKPTNSKSIQADDKDLENILDTLIENVQALNNEL